MQLRQRELNRAPRHLSQLLTNLVEGVLQVSDCIRTRILDIAAGRAGASRSSFTHHRVLDRGVDALSVLGNADLDGIVDRALDGNEDVDEVGTSREHGGVGGGWMKGKDQRDSGIQAAGYLEGGSGKTHRLTRTGGGKIVLSAAPSQVPQCRGEELGTEAG